MLSRYESRPSVERQNLSNSSSAFGSARRSIFQASPSTSISNRCCELTSNLRPLGLSTLNSPATFITSAALEERMRYPSTRKLRPTDKCELAFAIIRYINWINWNLTPPALSRRGGTLPFGLQPSTLAFVGLLCRSRRWGRVAACSQALSCLESGQCQGTKGSGEQSPEVTRVVGPPPGRSVASECGRSFHPAKP